ncbi:uncharacterized protein LOC144114885 [Amblyomma americanum]
MLFLLAAAHLSIRERSLWAYPRPDSWYETTLPHLSGSGLRKNFRINRGTFRYMVAVCGSMSRQDTNMLQPIPLEKRLAISLYRLATSAEERTAANLFGTHLMKLFPVQVPLGPPHRPLTTGCRVPDVFSKFFWTCQGTL